MNTSALILMIIAQGIIIACAGYFFYRVLKAPPKHEPDSYDENDEIPESERLG
jgi:hypothetical protein